MSTLLAILATGAALLATFMLGALSMRPRAKEPKP